MQKAREFEGLRGVESARRLDDHLEDGQGDLDSAVPSPEAGRPVTRDAYSPLEDEIDVGLAGVADGAVPVKSVPLITEEMDEEPSGSVVFPTDASPGGAAKRLLQGVSRFFARMMPRGGLLAGVFNFASLTLGAGIMSIPSAFNAAGMAMGVIYLIIVTALTIYSIQLLFIASQNTGLRSFEAIARALFGPAGEVGVAALMWLLTLGGSVGFVIAVGDVLERLFLDHLSLGRTPATCLVWLLFMFPLVLPKQVNSLRYVSLVGVGFIVLFVGCVVWHSVTHGMKDGLRGDLVMVRTGGTAISAISLFLYSYLCQIPVYSIAYEKKNPTVRAITLEAAIACCGCGVLYVVVGFFGYADFGPELTGNILKFFDPYENTIFLVCYVGLIVKLCAAFSLNMLGCRTACFQVMKWDVVTMPYWKHTLFSGSFALLALVLSLIIPDVNLVFGLVGALCGGFIGFIIPALFVMYSGDWNRETAGTAHYVATYFLLVCGVLAIILGTGTSLISIVKSASSPSHQ